MSSQYFEHFVDALPDPARLEVEKQKLEDAGVKYILSCWIDMFGQPKTKPVPISDFVPLCMGKGPQFAVHSISFVPELGPADADQVPLPDIDTIQICPWDPDHRLGLLRPVVGRQTLQPVPAPGIETRYARIGRAGLHDDGRY